MYYRQLSLPASFCYLFILVLNLFVDLFHLIELLIFIIAVLPHIGIYSIDLAGLVQADLLHLDHRARPTVFPQARPLRHRDEVAPFHRVAGVPERSSRLILFWSNEFLWRKWSWLAPHRQSTDWTFTTCCILVVFLRVHESSLRWLQIRHGCCGRHVWTQFPPLLVDGSATYLVLALLKIWMEAASVECPLIYLWRVV